MLKKIKACTLKNGAIALCKYTPKPFQTHRYILTIKRYFLAGGAAGGRICRSATMCKSFKIRGKR